MATKAEKEHYRRLVDYGCIACRNEFNVYSEPEIHHIRSGMGTSQRADWKRTLPLCPPHHRIGRYGVAFHAGRKAWERKHGTEEDLLKQLRDDLNIRGEDDVTFQA